MKLVTNNSDEDIRKNRLKEEVEWAARDLASNVLRVVRGAGKPYELVKQAAAFAELSREYRDAAGVWPYPEVAQVIALPRRERLHGDDADYLIDLGVTSAIKGALQIAASEIAEQRTQVAAGESQLFDGINLIEQGREMHRAPPRPFTTRARAKGAKGKGAATRSRKPGG